jgi:large repetitive protein
MATLRTVFLDTALTGYSNLANAYDPNVFNVVLLNNPAAGAMQIQNYLTANQLDASAINVVSASASVNGLFTSRVVFIDPGVANAAALIAAVPANATIVMLNAGTDGVQQISDFLAHNTGTVGAIDIISNIASVDVLSHGDAGEVTLGSTVLNASTIDTYRAQLADIGSHLAAGADILLYGCDVAAGTTGQQFIQELANATGADVAASTDLTGNAAAGGDWVLEASTGTIQTVAISAAAYTGVLDNATAIGSNFTISADTGTSSTDFFTKTATQTITGTFTASTSGTQAPTIYVSTDGSGAARTAATVTYTDNAGSGTFSVTVDLVTGAGKSIQFWTGQNGSNQIPNSAKAYTLDTIAPAATAIVTAINADTGSSGTDFITKTVSQAVSGTYSGTLDIVAATAETIQVSADGSTWINAIANTANHTWSASEVNLASGSGTLSVRTVDVAGNVTAGTPHIYTLDTTINAPTVSLSHDNGSDKTDKITNDASLTVLAPAESVTRTYKVDSAAASATYVAPTVNGSHTVVVTDVDTAGNTASSTIIFNLDTAINAPTVSLSHDNGSSNTDKITNDASLTVLAPAETVTRTYKVDSAAASSTYVAPTANGSHTVVVTDVDTAGNTASSNITFNLDTKINTPIVSLSHDNGSSNTDKITNDASLTLSTPTETVTRTYTIDGGTASSTYAAPAVNGSHTVVVTDVDTAGNTASSSITFNLDTKIAQSAITLNVDSGANNTDTLTNDASLTLSALDSDASRVITVDGNTVSAYDASSLAEGAHTVSISDTDAAGNTSSASTSFTLDTKIAKSAISLDTDSGANNTDTLTNDASLTLSALDSDASRVITVDGKTVTSYDASSLAQGAHTVSISDTDAAGNTSSASTSFTLDTKIAKSAITLNVDSGANNTDTLTNNASLTLSALDSDASRVITVDGKTVTSYDASSLAQGAHTVSISDTDAAGNTSSASTSFTLDTKIAKSAITLNVDSGNNNTDTLTNDASLTFSALDSDASRVITVDGTTVTAYNPSSLADGAHTVSISDTDAAGNTSSASTSFTLDTKIAKSAVTLNVDSGNNSTDTLTNDASLTLSALDSDASRVITVDGTTVTAYNPSSLADGAHTVSISDTDAAGNTSSASTSFTLDTKIAKSAITLNVDSGNNNTDTLTNDASLTLSALDSDASRMIKVDGNTVTSYDASSLADGAHTVSISDTDAAGNTSSASTSFTLDTKIAKSAVSLNVDSGNNSTDTLTNQAGLTLSTPAETVTRTYTVDGGTASATYVAPTVDGSHTVMVKDVDAAGNTASSSISFTLDSTGPLFTSSTTATVVENVGANQIIYQAAATDAHTFAYSLQAGADASAFSIDSNGAVHLLANPDFETKSSYAFTVLATDAAGNVSHQSVTLGITDINEAPQTSPIALSTVENAAILIPVVPDYAYDVDANDVVTLSSVGPVKLSWAADTTSTALINPVTKQNVDLSKLSTQVTISADGKTLTVNPAAELDWATTGEKLVATFNYTVHDNHGLTTTDSVTLTIWGSTGDKGLNLIGGNGNDLLVGSNGENVLQGGNGNDTLTGGTATDALYGGNGDDKVSGGDGIDYLYGDSGNDVLDGGAAHDILSGGKGNDILTGGSGADGFVFEPQFGTDRITDFHMSEGDRLYFVDLFAQPISAHDFVAKYVTHVNNNNSDLLISMAGGSITLVGVSDTTALEGAISFGMPS